MITPETNHHWGIVMIDYGWVKAAIPHTLGGPTDINLVPQLGSVNVGPFRPLEKAAVATPGSFYFTYWHYRGTTAQKPSGVDQDLLIPAGAADVRHHGN